MPNGDILRPPPNDGAKWFCSEGVPKPKPVFFAECGQPAVCVIIGKGARCAEHDPERDTTPACKLNTCKHPVHKHDLWGGSAVGWERRHT